LARDQVELQVQKIEGTEDIPLPRYMTGGSSGMDLYAAVQTVTTLLPGKSTLIPTGLRAAVPQGYELQIRPRSGLAAKHGISILNSPGTIDSDYRGEIKIIMINLGHEPFTIKRADRIAQMVLCVIPQALLVEVADLPSTERNDGGFGHTGS
jgi:dUTP pyrophosphatase